MKHMFADWLDKLLRGSVASRISCSNGTTNHQGELGLHCQRFNDLSAIVNERPAIKMAVVLVGARQAKVDAAVTGELKQTA
jgi:hypothetical protein